jgi:hypothetical protein
MKKYLLLLVLFLTGCPKPVVCPPPITVNCEYKVWPIERTPTLEEVVIRRLDDPNSIGSVTKSDIKTIGFDIQKLILWGSKNEGTLEEINRLSNKKQEKK